MPSMKYLDIIQQLVHSELSLTVAKESVDEVERFSTLQTGQVIDRSKVYQFLRSVSERYQASQRKLVIT